MNNATHYSRKIQTPTTKQEGLANAIQLAINNLEAGDSNEALLQLVNLLDDVRSNANPYNIGRTNREPKVNNYRGTVNVD